MNPELLLAHFNRISDAPDAIPRLRLFIFDLAIRGKLVEQDCNDAIASAEPVCIRRERREGVTSPYKIPSSWQFRDLRSISDQITDGEHATPPRIQEQQIPLVTAKNVRDGFMDFSKTDWVSFETATRAWRRCRPTEGDILLVCVGATTGRLCVLREPKGMVLVRSVALIRPSLISNVDYLALALRSPMVQSQIWKKVKVSAQPCLYINRINSLSIPVPPVPEQRRIVAKVEELMGLCDQLEAAQRERKTRQDRLTLASHHHLNNGAVAGGFRKHAHFFIGHIPHLTARRDQIDHLRQTILNIAVRGKLVPQDAVEDSAQALILAINAERERRIDHGQLKRTGPLKLTGNEKTFDYLVPSRWIFCFVDEFAIKVTDGEHATPMRCPSGHYLLSARNVTNGGIDVSDVDFVPPEEYVRIRKRCDPDKGDILISCSGSVGRVAVVDRDDTYTMVRSAALIKLDDSRISPKYVAYALRADPAQEQIALYSKSTAQANLFIGAIRKLRLPLPPLAEQHRIVAKVDDLLALCDRLEAELTTAQTETSRLLNAVLQQTLAENRQQEQPRPHRQQSSGI